MTKAGCRAAWGMKVKDTDRGLGLGLELATTDDCFSIILRVTAVNKPWYFQISVASITISEVTRKATHETKNFNKLHM